MKTFILKGSAPGEGCKHNVSAEDGRHGSLKHWGCVHTKTLLCTVGFLKWTNSNIFIFKKYFVPLLNNVESVQQMKLKKYVLLVVRKLLPHIMYMYLALLCVCVCVKYRVLHQWYERKPHLDSLLVLCI